MSDRSSCRVALLTPPGRGALATVLVVGDDVAAKIDRFFQAAGKCHWADRPPGRIVVGHWHDEKQVVEELVLCRRDAMQVEIHCHGGSAAAGRIIEGLVSAGCQLVGWKELAHRQAAGRLEAAAQVALAGASTQRTAAILLDQFRGALRTELEAIHQQLAIQPDIARLRLQTVLSRATLGLHLTHPWKVALTGCPNAGKSSLINALLGFERAIVFDQPGTTRDVVRASTAIDGWPVELADTAGIQESSDPLERAGIGLAHRYLQTADLVLRIVDLTRPASQQQLDAQLFAGDRKTFIIGNKCDLPAHPATVPTELRCSALTGEGIEELVTAIGQRLVPAPPPPGTAVPFEPVQIDRLGEAHEHSIHERIECAQQILAELLSEPGLSG